MATNKKVAKTIEFVNLFFALKQDSSYCSGMSGQSNGQLECKCPKWNKYARTRRIILIVTSTTTTMLAC